MRVPGGFQSTGRFRGSAATSPRLRLPGRDAWAETARRSDEPDRILQCGAHVEDGAGGQPLDAGQTTGDPGDQLTAPQGEPGKRSRPPELGEIDIQCVVVE